MSRQITISFVRYKFLLASVKELARENEITISEQITRILLDYFGNTDKPKRVKQNIAILDDWEIIKQKEVVDG